MKSILFNTFVSRSSWMSREMTLYDLLRRWYTWFVFDGSKGHEFQPSLLSH